MKKQKANLAVVPAKIAKPAKVPKLKTGDDAEVAAKFLSLFQSAQNGLRAVVAFGLYAEQVKMTKLKHGQFGDWVKGTLPDISWRSVQSHMQLATSVLEACGVKTLKPFFKSAACCAFEHSGMLLTAPEKECNKEAAELRNKIFSVIDGKSARQLFSEFKQAEEDPVTGEVKPKVGRMKGQGGASVAQRAAAAAVLEDARITGIETKGGDFIDWFYENCDDKNLGETSDAFRKRLLEAFELGVSYLRKLNHQDTKNTKGELPAKTAKGEQ